MGTMFRKGQRVIKIFTIGGIETGRVVTISKSTPQYVQCDGDDHLKYNQSGREIDPAPGFAGVGISSRLIEIDGD